MNIVEINHHNIYLLLQFLNNKLPNSFRYFNSRNPLTSIHNHILTILYLDNDKPFGYAHIDFDNHIYWFGICILDNYQSKGYGKKLLEYILNNDKIKNLNSIYLTVDKNNEKAINLYKKYGFIIDDIYHNNNPNSIFFRMYLQK